MAVATLDAALRQERLQWWDQRRTWSMNGGTSFFRLIQVLFTASRWSHRGEHTLAACIRHRHTSPSPGMMENVRLLPWPALSPDISPIENVCSVVAEVLARHHTPLTTVDELWYRVQVSWSSVPVHASYLCLT
ncbi:hypothetical protein TNCV_271121 [Trichonephila clavipes]|nr:hypothetical protein TNCV_271121 [Trichonephila clavipes]